MQLIAHVGTRLDTTVLPLPPSIINHPFARLLLHRSRCYGCHFLQQQGSRRSRRSVQQRKTEAGGCEGRAETAANAGNGGGSDRAEESEYQNGSTETSQKELTQAGGYHFWCYMIVHAML